MTSWRSLGLGAGERNQDAGMDSVTGIYHAERACESARCWYASWYHNQSWTRACRLPLPYSQPHFKHAFLFWRLYLEQNCTVDGDCASQRDSGELISFRLGLGNWALLSLESPPLIKPIKPRKLREGMGNMQGNSSWFG